MFEDRALPFTVLDVGTAPTSLAEYEGLDDALAQEYTSDIVLTKYKIAIFCDSEFFHGKDWEILKPRLQKTKNSDYWVNKISRNRERDAEIDKQLLFEGWTVIRFWGKDIIKKTDECVRVVEETIFDLKIGDAEDQLCELSEENEWIQNK